MNKQELQNLVWYEKYSPKKVADCILPQRIKTVLQQAVDSGSMQPMMFIGPPGAGKTTAARAIALELDGDILFIPASLKGNIDTIKTTVQQFASTMSIESRPKFVIFDEADGITFQAQQSLRGFIDEFMSVCTFIFTGNYGNKLIDALHSRCAEVDFAITRSEIGSLAQEFFVVCQNILDAEGIEYDKKTLLPYIKNLAPDWRQLLSVIQKNSSSGVLEPYRSLIDESGIIDVLLTKDFTTIRKWVAENPTISHDVIYKTLYKNVDKIFMPTSISDAILIIADYHYKSAFAVDQQINTTACLASLLSNTAIKS